MNEDDLIELECESGGGKPIPTVEWWNGTEKMDGECHQLIRVVCVNKISPVVKVRNNHNTHFYGKISHRTTVIS